MAKFKSKKFKPMTNKGMSGRKVGHKSVKAPKVFKPPKMGMAKVKKY